MQWEHDWWLKIALLLSLHSQEKEACFQPGLKCFAELRPLVLHHFITSKWLNKSSALSSFPSLCPLGPSASTCAFLTWKTHHRTLLACSSALGGPEKRSCCSWHLSGCHNILEVIYHVKGAPCALADQVKFSFLLWTRWRSPSRVLGLIGNKTLYRALSRNVFGCLIGFPPVFKGYGDTALVFDPALSLFMEIAAGAGPIWMFRLPWDAWVVVGIQANTGDLLRTLPGLRKKLPHQLAHGDVWQRLAPWARLLLTGGLHQVFGGPRGRGMLSHAPVFARGCLLSPWSLCKRLLSWSHNKIVM